MTDVNRKNLANIGKKKNHWSASTEKIWMTMTKKNPWPTLAKILHN